MSEIENGRANPELDTLGKIAAALGVHPHELFEERRGTPTEAQRLCRPLFDTPAAAHPWH
jgi:transcriptional regulator with XRE-family HTH domain